MKKSILATIITTAWISASEFVRNEFLLKNYWTKHYEGLGIIFPSEPLNGAVWGLWSLMFAIVILIISKKFSLIQTTLLAWFAGFWLMWVVVWNMGVLPLQILIFAIPLSLLEVFLASFIMHKLTGNKT